MLYIARVNQTVIKRNSHFYVHFQIQCYHTEFLYIVTLILEMKLNILVGEIGYFYNDLTIIKYDMYILINKY